MDVKDTCGNLNPCSDTCVQSVIEKFAKRSEEGLKKYGTTLDRKDIDLCGWLTHLQEELMDAVLYIERAKRDIVVID